MCGIAGFSLAAGSPSPGGDVVGQLLRALAARGPDGSGVAACGGTTMVHRRLSIIDVKGGAQPIWAGQNAALVANGEIYNDPELRDTLLRGVAFSGGSDCESALHLFLQEGGDYVRFLRGMYAIAICRTDHQCLTLARDPFGIKPLYMAERNGQFAFASEPRALVEAGFAGRRLNASARDELLQLQFITGHKTLLDGISRVLPGEVVGVSSGRISGRQRYALPVVRQQPAVTEAQAMQILDEALQDSLNVHERSDVPLGLFLSGGIDSCALLSMMRRLERRAACSWTAAFDVAGFADETKHASEMAALAGVRHQVVRITEAMVWRHLPEIVACMDDPAADYAIIPTWFLAREATKDVKVVLSGEGGDELFAGYGRYRAALRPWWRGRRAPYSKGIFDGLGVLRRTPSGWRDGIAAAEQQEQQRQPGRLMAAQGLDIAEWLPNDLLLKLDRCLMAHGVEGRTPFLDPVVFDAVFGFPDELKLRRGMGKWILRRWLQREMPQARPFAPKQGFSVPIGRWIEHQADRLGPLVARQPGVLEIAKPEQVVRLFHKAGGRREQRAAWGLLFYALWHRIYILGFAPQGDVFETLAGG